MDIRLLLEVDDALEHIPAFQVACFLLLNEDLAFTPEQFARLAVVLSPLHMGLIVRKLAADPTSWRSFRVSSSFLLPSTTEELRHLLDPTQQDEGSAPELDTVPAPEEYPLNSDPLEGCVIDEDVVEPCYVAPPSVNAPVLSIDECVQNPSLVSKRAIRSRLRAAAHHVKSAALTSAEFQQSKYLSDDFCAGKARGNYIISEPPGLLKSPEPVNVYELSKDVYGSAKAFDFVVYAPPSSGKSTFNHTGEFYDTDYMPAWNRLCPRKVITNMPHLLRNAKFSIAIVPSRETFELRCRDRGLDPLPSWYDDVLRECEAASITLYSENFVNDISHPYLSTAGVDCL